MASYGFVFSQFCISLRLPLQKVWRVFSRHLPRARDMRIFPEFQKLAYQITLPFRYFLPLRLFLGAYVVRFFSRLEGCFSPCLPYLKHYLNEYQEKDVMDLRTNDYHNDAKHTRYHLARYTVKTMIHDALNIPRHLCGLFHSQCYLVFQSIPSIFDYCKKFLMIVYQSSPKSGLYLSVLKYSYQCASIALGQSQTVYRPCWVNYFPIITGNYGK